ncbi:MAG TPA: ABC transporter substrate-binding protein [Phycisphaerae bacterium]|nr:ABC transporter substrate-binding protein [Phycisphaerae bacterium]
MKTLVCWLWCTLGIVLAAGMVSCDKKAGGGGGGAQLIIVSPHGSDIRREFAIAFENWHREKYGSDVNLNWADLGGGGTGNIVKALSANYAAGTSAGYDIMWGGGSRTFSDLNAQGFLQKPDLPAEVLAQVPADIHGSPLHGTGDNWIAATMSNFGIAINKDRIAELGLKTPRYWEDIAGPDWYGRLSLGDPSKSGSVRTSYEMVLQQYGWEKGWRVLTQMFANAGVLRDTGSDPAYDVGSAEAIAGATIDFFARKQIVRVGPRIAGFIVPEGGSTVDADPIAMFKGAPHAELAAHFIQFVISPAGQRLWVFRPGTPGGPVHSGLGRMTVLPELYEKESQYMTDPTNPFGATEQLKPNPADGAKFRTIFIGDLIKAAMVDNYQALMAARGAVKRAGDPPELLARFGELPTFVPTKVQEGRLVDGPARVISASPQDQQAVADEYSPTSREKRAFLEHLQARLKERWRNEAAQRYAEIQRAAEGGAGWGK